MSLMITVAQHAAATQSILRIGRRRKAFALLGIGSSRMLGQCYSNGVICHDKTIIKLSRSSPNQELKPVLLFPPFRSCGPVHATLKSAISGGCLMMRDAIHNGSGLAEKKPTRRGAAAAPELVGTSVWVRLAFGAVCRAQRNLVGSPAPITTSITTNPRCSRSFPPNPSHISHIT